MNFYCITDLENEKEGQLLKDACEKRSINFFEINTSRNKLDFVNYPHPLAGDCLYKVTSNDLNAKKIEYSLINDSVATFYKSLNSATRQSSALKLPKFNVLTPKTVPVLTNNRNLLKTYADYLGGFPLIVKALGGKEGIGVMRIDSIQSLYSVADFLYKNGGNYILREYIDIRESIRLVVVGDAVVSSIKYKASNEGDFRSNRRSGFDHIESFECDDDIKNTAIKAVNCMDLEFGGVDVLVDEKNNAYVLEVNCPCQFSEPQIVTGIDIAGIMVDFLIRKSKLILKNNK